MSKDDHFGVYDILNDSARMLKESGDWVKAEAESIRKASSKARSTGRPAVTAEQSTFRVRVKGRRHFMALVGHALTVLFEGEVTMRFRKR